MYLRTRRFGSRESRPRCRNREKFDARYMYVMRIVSTETPICINLRHEKNQIFQTSMHAANHEFPVSTFRFSHLNQALQIRSVDDNSKNKYFRKRARWVGRRSSSRRACFASIFISSVINETALIRKFNLFPVKMRVNFWPTLFNVVANGTHRDSISWSCMR